jgi:hypothetical protein
MLTSPKELSFADADAQEQDSAPALPTAALATRRANADQALYKPALQPFYCQTATYVMGGPGASVSADASQIAVGCGRGRQMRKTMPPLCLTAAQKLSCTVILGCFMGHGHIFWCCQATGLL